MHRKANITVIGYPKILSQCQEIAEEYLNTANFLYYQYLPKSGDVKYIAASPDHPLQGKTKIFNKITHDIIVTGIVTAKAMPMVDNNKIIPFRTGHKAIIKAFLKAKKITNSVAFISPIEEKHDVRFYEKLVGLKIDIFYAKDLGDYRPICSKLYKSGHSVVVSGSYTFQIAREYGLQPVFLFSDDDIFHDVYTRALETHRYNQSLEEKISQLEIISQKSEDGIIFIDNSNRITFTNNVTELKLNLDTKHIIGRHVSAVFDFIDPVILKKRQDSEIIGTFAGEQLLMAIHPVVVGSQTAGTVLLIKKTKEIAALDTRVRQKTRFKGFMAKYSFQDILGNSSTMAECKKKAMLYADSDAPVLIYGETGTGKELFAQSIHNKSSREHFPFVAINCATLPPDLMESELFGYVKGAFTGARSKGKQGLVDQAHLGTLFLDEVDSLPISLQPKLLRLLQEKEFIRVGGEELIPVNIRIIAACNRNPDESFKNNLLRQDLFYRLSVLYLQLPDLHERESDIPLLFTHFLKESDAELARMFVKVPSGVTDLLSQFSFKGNLRELQSIATRFACLCERKKIHDNNYMENLIQSCCHTDQNSLEKAFAAGRLFDDVDNTLSESMKKAEKEILQLSKNRCSGSIQQMAKQLGVGRTTLWRKLKDHGIG